MVNLKVSFQSANPLRDLKSKDLYSPSIHSKREKQQRNIRILLVDDQNLIRQKLRVYLEAESDVQVVGSVENGQTALEQVKILHPDLVLVDIEMPGMDGLMTTRIIKERFADIKVVIFSSYDDKHYVSQALEEGAKGYLLKNTPIEEIVHAIRFVHKGYLQLSPGLYEKLESEKTTKIQNELELYHHNSSQDLEVVKSQSKQIAQLEPAKSPEQDWSSLTKELVNTLPRVWTRGLLYFLVFFRRDRLTLVDAVKS